jgi:YidC/Oxa1 family membrane protein insertase
MAESVGGGNQGQGPKKEISMERRLLLAFVLMGAVMFLTPYFIKSPPSQQPAKKAETASAPAQSSPAPVEVKTAKTGAPSASATPQASLPPYVIETDLFRVTFSNQGATVRSWQLKKFTGNDEKPLDLINSAAAMEYPFSLYLPGQDQLAKTINWAQFVQTPDADGLGVTYTFSDGHASVKKSFRFEKNSYVSRVSASVTLDGNPVNSLIAWRGGFGDLTLATASSNSRAIRFEPTNNKLIEQNSGAAKNGPIATTGNFSFSGLADSYFAAVFVPEGNSAVQETTFTNYVATPIAKETAPFAGIAVGDGRENRFELFAGPKDYDQLQKINPKLQQLIDFGWLSLLAKPLFLVTNWFNDAFVHNYGWSIVLVTVALNMMLFPVKLTTMKSARKMQALKPQIDVINQKYKNIGIRDPRKAEQNQEVMELYKKNGVNPMGGCVPTLLQIPFFFAFYKVFTVSVEMRGASWLWVHDLSQPEQLAIRILPLIMVGSQFYLQKMTPQPAGDPNQQKMMMFMPLIFGFMFYQFPSGLVLYYLTSNLVGVAQQLFFNSTAVEEIPSPAALAKNKNARK